MSLAICLVTVGAGTYHFSEVRETKDIVGYCYGGLSSTGFNPRWRLLLGLCLVFRANRIGPLG